MDNPPVVIILVALPAVKPKEDMDQGENQHQIHEDRHQLSEGG